MLHYEFLDIDEVVSVLQNKPPDKHVILTGRDAPEKIVALADLVTEMRCVKHSYEQGIQAQPGIEY